MRVPAPSNKKRFRFTVALVVILSLIILSGLLLAYLLRDMDWAVVRQTNLSILLLILLLTGLTIFTYTLMVYLLIRSSGYATTLWKTFLILSSSLSANYLTPVKVGAPLRVFLYSYFVGIPVASGTALMTIELLVSLLVPIFLAVVGIVLIFPSLGVSTPIILLTLLLGGLVIAVRMPIGRLQIYLKWLPFSTFVLRLLVFIQNVQHALLQTSPTTIFGVVLLMLLMIGEQVVRLRLILSIFGSPLPSLFALFAVFTISATAGSLSMVPMGLGVREVSFTVLLMQLGVNSDIALSTAIIERFFSSGLSLVLGIIAINILGVRELVKNSDDIATT